MGRSGRPGRTTAVAVVTAGFYYGNDHLASLVPQTVFDEYVLPSVDAAR